MKYPSIGLFVRTENVHVGMFDDDTNQFKVIMNVERFKRLIIYPEGPFNWVDAWGHVDIGPRWPHLVSIISQDFADVLAQHPNEIERIFKRCFLNIAPELAGAEIKDVDVHVYHPSTQDADAQ
jgi:hypothetical protein